MTSPFDKVLARLSGVKKNGAGVMALCPAHDDSTPSLHVTEKRDGTVLLKCHADCEAEDIVAALGLKFADLFPPKKTASAKEARDVKAKEYREQEAGSRKAIDPAAFWDKASPARKHPYLKAKGVGAHGELRVRQGDLLVPMRDAAGDLINVQRISPGGDKKFLPGCPTKGGYYLIEGGETLLVAEGYATGATLAEETGATVAVAFSAGNVPAVAKTLGEKLDAKPVIATDADEAGQRAAREAQGVAFLPPFKDGDEGTDWNDWHALYPTKSIERKLGLALRVAKEERPRGRYLYSVDDLYKTSAKADMLIADYIEAGTVGQVFGPPSGESPPSGGKTLVLVDVFCSCATGRDWCGKKVKQGLVVLLAGEGIGDMQRRVKAWLDEHGYAREEAAAFPIVVTGGMPVDFYDERAMREFVAELEPHVRKHGAPVLIGLDTQKTHLRGDENSSSDITELIRLVTKYLRVPYEPMPALVLAHHVGHTATDRPRGHSSQMGDFDFYSKVDRQANGQVVLWPKKLKGLPVPPPLVFNVKVNERFASVVAFHNPEAKVGEAAAQPKQLGANQRALLDALPEDPQESMSEARWRRKVELSAKQFAEASAALVKRGVVILEEGRACRREAP